MFYAPLHYPVIASSIARAGFFGAPLYAIDDV
jgi:hypothetical protein